METIKIVSRWDAKNVLFKCEVPDSIAPGERMKYAVEKAVVAGAILQGAGLQGTNLQGAGLQGTNLRGANLRWSDLRETNLQGAGLREADLREVSLRRANLQEANLQGADLRGANLQGANLQRANLHGAYLHGADFRQAHLRDDARTIGLRPMLQIGPIGSRDDTLTAFFTNKGDYMQTGCFFGRREAFLQSLNAEHGDNKHGQEYMAALALIDLHAEIWSKT